MSATKKPKLSENDDSDMKSAKLIMPGVRWAFRCGTWNPTQEEWMKAAQCVQPEEKTRIGKFVFKKDGKSAMAGRLLLRKVIHDTLGINYADIKMDRTEKGKPFLTNTLPDGLSDFNFNVSHQGEYAVLASDTHHLVGVDIMKIEPPRPGGNKEFFETMSRQFTFKEWKTIKCTSDEHEQLSRFYRFWCLKESYVKALGIGIGFDLQRLSFSAPTLTLTQDVVTQDTQVYVDDKLQEDWTFQEAMLDDTHCIAVALQRNTKVSEWPPSVDMKDMIFKQLTFDELMQDWQPLSEPDPVYWENFNSKSEKPPGRR